MKQRTHLALLAVLIIAGATTASAQDVNVTSTTMAQSWQENLPGSGKANFLPGTEYLGIDITKLGDEHLSAHLYGWGTTDFREQSMVQSKTDSDFTYGYLEYRFDQANANIKLGQFTVNNGIGNEVVDGVSARTDLVGGLTISGFAGAPVIYKNYSDYQVANPHSLGFQQNIIFGARLGYQISKLGEIGLSFTQDGQRQAWDLSTPQPVDFTRRLTGVDFHLAPCSFINVSGRTIVDTSQQIDAPESAQKHKVAEHDYTATVRANDKLSFTGEFIERNFVAYYTGTTLPNLFNLNETGMLRSTRAAATYSPFDMLQIVADVKRTDREDYGTATRAGADLRFHFSDAHVLAGVGYHKVNAFAVQSVDPNQMSYSLTHSEARAWAMYEKGAFSASLDGILFKYTDADLNPNLNGKSTESELIASLGYQLNKAFKVSGDLTFDNTVIYQKQTIGTVRLEYRFGTAALGGK